MSRKPTEAEIAEYVRRQQAQQSTGAAQYNDSQLRQQERQNTLEARAQRVALQRLHEEQAARTEANIEKRKAMLAEREQALATERDAELEPVKEQRFREWQAENPTLGRATFEAKVWPVERERQYGREAMLAREIEAQRDRR